MTLARVYNHAVIVADWWVWLTGPGGEGQMALEMTALGRRALLPGRSNPLSVGAAIYLVPGGAASENAF